MFIFKYLLTPKFLKHVYISFKKNHSVVRLIHNFFLKNIVLDGKVIDLGAGNGSNLSYYDHLDTSKASIEKIDLYKDSDKEINLEKNWKLKVKLMIV